MLYVIIPVKRSSRFPGKNEVLAPYTRGWLAQELLYVPCSVAVYTVGRWEERPSCFPPPALWPHFEADGRGGMQGDLELFTRAMMARDEDALFVLCQLTQPLRERGLLTRAVELVRDEWQLPVVSGINSRTDGWRVMDDDGRHGAHAPDDARVIRLDGAVYAWRGVEALLRIFDPNARKVVLERFAVPAVDVDWREDVPPALAAQWAELMVGV